MRRAKIIATLGPSSNSIQMIEELIRAGMNVARINMGHGTHQHHRSLIEKIREASRNTGREVAIILDLQGPKIRTDKLTVDLRLTDGSEWVIGPTRLMSEYPEYADRYIPTIYDNLVADCHDGARILFDDGKIVAMAKARDRDVYRIWVTCGGILSSNKGINLPDCRVSCPAFTVKDKEDLRFGLENGIDYVALSFVRSRADVEKVRIFLDKMSVSLPIIAKIENQQGVDNIDEITEIADVIMVARGDMGVEVGNHLVPIIQKEIIEKCNNIGAPVITATQMLESMMSSSTPTRAEASDVANAIWDGTDAVMLSGESASGKYPTESVKTMAQIVETAEKKPKERSLIRNLDLRNINTASMVAASLIAEKIDARAIVSITEAGNSCREISRFRPEKRVLGVTRSINTVRRICLYWGVIPYLHVTDPEIHGELNLEFDAIARIKKDFALCNGDKIVVTRGDGKIFHRGNSNSIRVEILGEEAG